MSNFIKKIICLFFGHQDYNQSVGMGTKDHHFVRICYRCGRVERRETPNPWYKKELESEYTQGI